MELGLTTAVYIAAAVLFILSLGGLSGQESAKRAVWYGIFGMAFAIIATLIGPGNGLWWLSLGLIGAGGLIGYTLASKARTCCWHARACWSSGCFCWFQRSF